MKKRVLLGTTNQAKMNIVRAALESLPVELLSLDDLNIDADVREDGQSAEENAERKARAYFAESDVPTLAIDGGLHIEKFPEEKQPGVLVRRIRGVDGDATDKEVWDHYAEELAKVGGESVGTWRGAIVLVISDSKAFSHSFSFEAVLTSRRRGAAAPGSPLDSLMIDPATGKYYSEMPYEERPDTRWIHEFMKQHIEEL